MIKRTLKRLKRAPVRAVAVLLFAFLVSMTVCALQSSNAEEVRHYEETLKTVPITVNVTRLLKNNTSDTPIQPWVLDIFTSAEPVKFYDISGLESLGDGEALREIIETTEPIELSLAEYAKDVQVHLQHGISTINGVACKNYKNPMLNGISSITCDEKLLPEYGCEIKWKRGYDESIFDGDELVCIIPKEKAEQYDNGQGETVLEFVGKVLDRVNIEGKWQVMPVEIKYQCTLKIVGTYTVGDGKSIYCPIPNFEAIYTELVEEPGVSSLSFTLADNFRLEEFREKMSFCFIEASPDLEKIPWRYLANTWSNEHLPYALDIKDEKVFDLTDLLEKSINVNRNVTIIIIALSVVSGFLVGFLMIRRRKRDIMLMRTVGESTFSLYVGFVLEQMICIVLGIALGGAYYRWQPIEKLALFAVVYFVALTLALVIFLSKKLIRNVKEDE